jgi:hypothetical protein
MTAQNNLSPLIDALGTVRAQMAALEAKDKEIKEALASLVAGTYEGDKYKLTIIMPEKGREKIDWEGIARKLKASDKLIKANTTTGNPIRTLRTAIKDDVPEVEV